MSNALTMDYFRNLKKGAIITLHYNLYNKGTFVWIHDHVGPAADILDKSDRVWGRFVYEGDSIDDAEIGAYLYEFEGYVCRGSGAEPVHLEMPEDPLDEEDEDDWDEDDTDEDDTDEASDLIDFLGKLQ